MVNFEFKLKQDSILLILIIIQLTALKYLTIDQFIILILFVLIIKHHFVFILHFIKLLALIINLKQLIKFKVKDLLYLFNLLLRFNFSLSNCKLLKIRQEILLFINSINKVQILHKIPLILINIQRLLDLIKAFILKQHYFLLVRQQVIIINLNLIKIF